MKTSLHHIVLAALASTAALGGALAQSTAPDIDLEAIRARAMSEAGEADALAAYLRAAGNTHVEVLRTPLITHADAAPAGAGDTWRLIRFWARMWKEITE